MRVGDVARLAWHPDRHGDMAVAGGSTPAWAQSRPRLRDVVPGEERGGGRVVPVAGWCAALPHAS